MATRCDISTRFIIDENAPYLSNLAALWTADPALAAEIEAADENNRYAVESCKNGLPTVSVKTDDGQKVLLHSRYDPVGEARRLIESIGTTQAMAFYVYGFGLGYHVGQLLEETADEAIVFVFEPDVALLRVALEQRDYSRFIESKRLAFITRADKSELMLRLTPKAAFISIGAKEIIHHPSQRLAGAFHTQMRQWIDEFASYCRTSLNTLVLNGRKTAENVAQTIGWYLAAPDMARLRDAHRGQPAVIVSAGPSLRKNKHLLKDLRERAVIIAVQTTLQPLLDMGIEPHYVTSLDYHEICTRFFEKLPKTINTELVAEPKANAAIFRMYPGAISMLGNRYAEDLLREMKLNKERLRDGATVAHLAYYLAEHLGCDPIMFIGQDLGFGEGLCYAPGTSYEDVWRPELSRFCTVEMKQWDQIVRERFILRRIPDFQGRPMYTEERLFTYLQQFERDFAQSKAKIIDATEGGAAKRGATVMPFAQAIEEYCTEAISRPPAHPGLDFGRGAEAIECLRARCVEAAEIEQIARKTLPMLDEIRRSDSDQARVNRLIASIDALRVRMNELGPCYDLVTHLTQQTEMQRFTADRRIAAAKVDAAERQRLQVERDMRNVSAMAEAAVDFQRIINKVISILLTDANFQPGSKAA